MVVVEVQGAAGHVISVMQPESWRESDQGYALCTCGWSNQDVLYRNAHDAALRHAKTTTGATSAIHDARLPAGDRGLAAAPVVPHPHPPLAGDPSTPCASDRGLGGSGAGVPVDLTGDM